MKNRTSFITNETVKMHTSFAKTFFIIAGAALLFSLTVYVYYNFIRTESLKFYKDMDNCSVSLRTETHRTRSGRRSKTRTSYYVYVTTPEGEQNLKMNVSRSYYDAMSLYNGKKDITLSFFKTKSGELFPSTIAGCSEKEAGRQYVKCYPPNMLNTVMLVIACIGAAFIGAGLLAMRTAKKCAKIVTKNDVVKAAAAMTIAMGMSADDAEAARAAFADMADDMGAKCAIVQLNPFRGFIA